MKKLEIYFDSYILENIQEEIKEFGVEKYILIPEVFSDWGKKLKHFNSHLWPGTDSILVMFLEDSQAKEMVESIKIIKSELGDMISVGVVVTDVVDLVL